LKAFSLLAFLSISSSMAATVNLGSVIDLSSGIKSTDYSVTILSVQTTAQTSDDNSKAFGHWKSCFTRYENMPPMPLQKYVYVPMSAHKDSNGLVTAGENTLDINDALIADLAQVTNELSQKTEGKCKFEASTRIEFKVELKRSNFTVKSDVWISKKGSAMTVTFAQWVGGNLGFSQVTETLPNKTPVHMTAY
jgi:hypothetical protein